MGYVLCTWRSDSVEAPTMLHGLFKGYSRMSDYAKGSGKSTKKKQDDKKSTQCKDLNQGKSKCELFVHPPTILNLKCISRLLAVLNGCVCFTPFMDVHKTKLCNSTYFSACLLPGLWSRIMTY